MKVKKSTYIISLFLMLAMGSCSLGPDDTGDGRKTGETGSLALSIRLAGIDGTRAGGESSGIPQESKVNSIRIILYSPQGIAEHIWDYYNISYNGTGWDYDVWNFETWEPEPNSDETFTISSASDGTPVMKKVIKDITVGNGYQLLAIINPVEGPNGYNGLGSYMVNNAWNGSKTYLLESGKLGHNLSIFRQAINLQSAPGGSTLDNYFNLFNSGLTGLNVWFPYDMEYTDERLDRMSFLMSNSDGITRIYESDFKPTPEEAAASPITVNVERSAAKVALYKGFDSLPNGASIAGLRWACDILNMHFYLVRKSAAVAPSGGGGPETAATPRAYRYATDPNFTGISHGANASPSGDPSDHFASLKEALQYMGDEHLRDMVMKDWNTNNGGKVEIDDMDNYMETWEYVSENTMDAAEQYEDVTTRVLISCNYIPAPFQSGIAGTTFAEGESYYGYGGYVFTHSEIISFATDAVEVPVDTYPSLLGLRELLDDQNTRDIFNWTDPDPSNWTVPYLSARSEGLSFYLDGLSYYRILIRHFDDTESPDMMGYGRYGVVRNNVYKIRVTNIKGPGSPVIPESEDPDDKEEQLEVQFLVSPWKNVVLNYNM